MKNVGVIGCGNILETYLRSQEYFNNINFVSCSDINMEIAKKTASENNLKAQTVEELLSDKTISYNEKHEVVNAYSKFSVRIVNCYKEQIHYEALLSNLIYIYHK